MSLGHNLGAEGNLILVPLPSPLSLEFVEMLRTSRVTWRLWCYDAQRGFENHFSFLPCVGEYCYGLIFSDMF